MIIAQVQGCYENKLYTGNAKNDSHNVKITWDENAEKFTWMTKAGVAWTLYPVQENGQWSTTKLHVDSPMYPKYEEAGMETLNGNSIIHWLNEPYTKDVNACP